MVRCDEAASPSASSITSCIAESVGTSGWSALCVGASSSAGDYVAHMTNKCSVPKRVFDMQHALISIYHSIYVLQVPLGTWFAPELPLASPYPVLMSVCVFAH